MSSSREPSPVGKRKKYLTFSERYFTPLYKLNYVDKVAETSADAANDLLTVPTDEPSAEAALRVAPPADASPEETPSDVTALSDLAVDQDHVKILLHSNGICVLTLAPSHPILANRLTVENVDFQVSKRVNRLQNAVKGKGKKGGQFFADDKQTVAFVTCDDGSRHVLHNGVRGALIEVNERLVDMPDLLTSDPFGQGFLAIILPRKGERDAQKLNLVSENVYEKFAKEGLVAE